MFYASKFNQNINSWDVSNVTDMSYMFRLAKKFNQPLNRWNVSEVIDMSEMFEAAYKFNQALNSWDVSNVKDMSYMFNNAKEFNQPLDNWNVSNVEDMSHMFSNAKKFNQPINSWNVSKVEYMDYMFDGCELLKIIDVSNLDGAKVSTGANISQSGNSFTANDSAQSQSTSGVLDSNGIGWSFEKGQRINFTFIHSNTSDTSFSIVGGVFGRASQKEVKEKPISIQEYTEPKYTPKPYVQIKPYVPVPEEKELNVEYHKAYVKEVPVTPETPKIPEPPKPQEPNKPTLPNTGTAASMLPLIGIVSGMLGLVGLKRKNEAE